MSGGAPRPGAAGRVALRACSRGRTAVAAVAALLAAALAAFGAVPDAARAQEPGSGTDTVEVAPPEAPAMADAPTQFRVAPYAGRLSWSDPTAPAAEPEAPGPGAVALDGSGVYGVQLESRLVPYLGFRLGASYGTSEAAAPGAGPVEVNQVLGEVSTVLRLALPTMRRAGVVPFGTAGLGTVVHDPKTPDGRQLITRSQTGFLFGAGVDADLPGVSRAGLRVEWQRAEVQLENLLDPADRSSVNREADRFVGALTWAF